MTTDGAGRLGGIPVRLKLALSYAGFVVVAGVVLFLVGLLLLRFVPDGALFVSTGGWAPNRSDLLEVFLRYTGWALAGLVVVGLVGGWILAGVMLRPLGQITDAAHRVRRGEFTSRVALAGRRDELTDLADAFDGMLDRVQRTIDEERRFAANASHELRTPHAVIRTMVEVARADPEGRDVELVLERIASTNDRAIATTEALLTLARAGRGTDLQRGSVDLAALVADELDDLLPEAAHRGISFEASVPPTTVVGDRALLAQLVRNLAHNAVVHNVRGGWVRVSVTSSGSPSGPSSEPSSSASSVRLTIENSGPVLERALVRTLTEPFVRASARTNDAEASVGSGLGLAIVASIARAHGGRLSIAGRPEGGLRVRVTLPR